jgi:hypothetical protein
LNNVLILMFVLILGASMAFAQTPGHLGLYSDANASDCRVLETAYPTIYQVYVIHELASDVAGCVFSVPVPSCAAVSWIADESDFVVKVGFSPSGVDFGYGGCRISPIVVTRILYLGSATQDCCPLVIEGSTVPVEPDYPAAVVCGMEWHNEPVTVSPAYFHSNATCGCTVPAQETTWGAVKALYTE